MDHRSPSLPDAPASTEAADLTPEAAAAALFDPRWLRGGDCLPLQVREGVLRLAVTEHTPRELLEAIRFGTGHLLEPVTVDRRALAAASEHLLAQLEADARDRAERALGHDAADPLATPDTDTDALTADAPVVRYLQQILEEAARAGVSDIHLEPYERSYRVRYRLDGVLHEARQPPPTLRERLAARVKVLARLDIAERRRPQDGRIRMHVDGAGSIDLRVSTLPTLFGEKVVLRVLRDHGGQLDVDQLGLEPVQKAALLEALQRPDGMILVTGPTGSGKTMTLYTLLTRLNQPDSNISSVEDPAELHLPGINQVNVNERTGLGFANALRALLRQDPDTLMVGEIRDLETADIAIKAAQTGHRVLSTLHTRDAPGTLARLVNMGIAPFQVAGAVRLITAQRLVRRLCVHCRRPDDAATAQLAEPERAAQPVGPADERGTATTRSAARVYAATGCAACGWTGFRGRVGVHQVMPVSDALHDLILRQAGTRELAMQAQREGVSTLREAALSKVRAGLTSLAEAESTCHA